MTESKNPSKQDKAEAAGRSEPDQDSPAFQFTELVGANDAAMDAFVRSGEVVLKGWATINEAMMSFANRRARASIDTCQSLARCSTFAEAMELQSSHARHTTEDYLKQASEMLNLSAEVAKDGMAQLQNNAHESMARTKK